MVMIILLWVKARNMLLWMLDPILVIMQYSNPWRTVLIAFSTLLILTMKNLKLYPADKIKVFIISNILEDINVILSNHDQLEKVGPNKKKSLVKICTKWPTTEVERNFKLELNASKQNFYSEPKVIVTLIIAKGKYNKWERMFCCSLKSSRILD